MGLKRYLTTTLLIAVTLSAIANLIGLPAMVEHWESGFGDLWMPFFEALDNNQKRILAGTWHDFYLYRCFNFYMN